MEIAAFAIVAIIVAVALLRVARGRRRRRRNIAHQQAARESKQILTDFEALAGARDGPFPIAVDETNRVIEPPPSRKTHLRVHQAI